VRVDPTGHLGPTRMQSRGRHWRRTSRGLFVPSSVDPTVPEQRIIEAAAVLPAYGGVTGWGALRWAGGVWFDGLARDGRACLPVTLATMRCYIREQKGIAVSEERLSPLDLTELDGLRMTTAVRSLCFLMRYAPTDREAVVFADMAAYSDLVSTNELAVYIAAHPGWTGIPQARKALPLVEENSWSPWESRMRLAWMLDADFPRPLCNVPVFDRWGNHLGTPDLLDPHAGVVGEYNGALHLQGGQRRRDRAREEAFRRVGLEYFTMMSGDDLDPYGLVRRMEEARTRARWLAPSRRDWTTDLPRWWIPTFTVEQRRNLEERDRQRLLRLRLRAG
jgi:hypothetical protein